MFEYIPVAANDERDPAQTGAEHGPDLPGAVAPRAGQDIFAMVIEEVVSLPFFGKDRATVAWRTYITGRGFARASSMKVLYPGRLGPIHE